MAGRVGCRIPFPHGCGLPAQTGRATLAEQDRIGSRRTTAMVVLLLAVIAVLVFMILLNMLPPIPY